MPTDDVCRVLRCQKTPSINQIDLIKSGKFILTHTAMLFFNRLTERSFPTKKTLANDLASSKRIVSRAFRLASIPRQR